MNFGGTQFLSEQCWLMTLISNQLKGNGKGKQELEGEGNVPIFAEEGTSEIHVALVNSPLPLTVFKNWWDRGWEEHHGEGSWKDAERKGMFIL